MGKAIKRKLTFSVALDDETQPKPKVKKNRKSDTIAISRHDKHNISHRDALKNESNNASNRNGSYLCKNATISGNNAVLTQDIWYHHIFIYLTKDIVKSLRMTCKYFRYFSHFFLIHSNSS